MKQVTDRRKEGKKTTRNDGKKQEKRQNSWVEDRAIPKAEPEKSETLKAKNQNLKLIPCNNDDANQKGAASSWSYRKRCHHEAEHWE